MLKVGEALLLVGSNFGGRVPHVGTTPVVG